MHLKNISWSRIWPPLFWSLVVLVLFVPVLPYYAVLPSPDSAPFYFQNARLRFLDTLLQGGVSLAPHDLVRVLLPPLLYHDLSYLIDTLLVALGMFFFLRALSVPHVCAWLSGGILALAGYSFTLIYAGHRGFFNMSVYGVFMLGFIVRAMQWGHWRYFFLAGACAAWLIRFAPDLAIVYMTLGLAYGLWLLCRNAARQPLRNRLLMLARAAPIAILGFGLIAAPSLRKLLDEHLRNRLQQIEQSFPRLTNAQSEVSADKQSEQQKWIFATNWSLPPSELVELIAPCLLGYQSGDKRVPYWGQLGRSHGWAQHRQGFPNFRQHAIYLGALPLSLAAIAIVMAFLARRRSETKGGGDRACSEGPEYLADVPFWMTVGIIGLLLSFGRYAPFYRLFYSLPYMSLLRAPVKFIRLVELSVAILAGLGLTALVTKVTLPKKTARIRRGAAIAGGLLALLAALTALIISLRSDLLVPSLTHFNAASYAPRFAAHMSRAFLHALMGFGLFAGLAFLLYREKIGSGTACAVITVAIGIDLASVNRHFITAMDIAPWYRPNLVMEEVLNNMPHGAALANHATPRNSRHWFSGSLLYAGIRPSTPTSEDELRDLLRHANGDITRFWQVAGAGYALIPASWSRSIDRTLCDRVAWLDIGQGTVATTSAREEAVEFMRLNPLPPYAQLHAQWRTLPADEAKAALFRHPPHSREAIVVSDRELASTSASNNDSKGEVRVRSSRFRNGALATRIEVDLPSSMLLTIRETPNSNLVAFVDGKPHETVEAEYRHIGLILEAGKHVIVLRSRRSHGFMTGLNLLTLLFFLGCLPTWKRSEHPNGPQDTRTTVQSRTDKTKHTAT